MKPLLAHIYEPHRVQFPCFVQPKLNGIRALYQTGADGVGRFQSRDEIPFPPGLLDHLTKPLQSIFDQSIILDGELYVHGWPLQRINAAVTPVRQKPTEDTPLVEYHVFDRVDYGRPFRDRFYNSNSQYLRRVSPCVGVHHVSTLSIGSEDQANQWYATWVRHGYEGMMYRLDDCPYTLPKQPAVKSQSSRLKFLSDQDNRVWHLLKRKDWQDDEFVCIGVEEGEGKYKGMVGALIYGIAGLETNGMIQSWKKFSAGSGLTDIQREKYFDHPELVVGKPHKIKYLCLSSDGIPLNPTILLIP